MAPEGDFQVVHGLLELLLPQLDHRYVVLRLVEEAMDTGPFSLLDDVFLQQVIHDGFAFPSKPQIVVDGLDGVADFSVFSKAR